MHRFPFSIAMFAVTFALCLLVPDYTVGAQTSTTVPNAGLFQVSPQ